MDTDTLWRSLKRNAIHGRPVLYIHGAINGFRQGARQTARLQLNLGLGGRLLWFTWPSDGSPTAYTKDEADIAWSIADFVSVLDRLGRDYGDRGFDIVAHSLGARGIVQALLRRTCTCGRPPRANNLVLVAPDIDAGTFQRDLSRLKTLAGNVTIYVSSRDLPLQFSARAHGYPRLGQSGSHLEGLDGIDIMDVSELKKHRVSGHMYHLFNPVVISDLRQLIEQSRRPADRGALSQSDGTWLLRRAPRP